MASRDRGLSPARGPPGGALDLTIIGVVLRMVLSPHTTHHTPAAAAAARPHDNWYGVEPAAACSLGPLGMGPLGPLETRRRFVHVATLGISLL